jgi:hypothetical protein
VLAITLLPNDDLCEFAYVGLLSAVDSTHGSTLIATHGDFLQGPPALQEASKPMFAEMLKQMKRMTFVKRVRCLPPALSPTTSLHLSGPNHACPCQAYLEPLKALHTLLSVPQWTMQV